MSQGYIEGDHWVIDDRTGRKVRASQTVKEWTGSIVDRRHAIDLQRHPQEMPLTISERQSVPNARPRPVDIFTGPLDTQTVAAFPAGSVFLRVVSSVRFRVGDEIGIMLSNLDHHRTRLRQVYASLVLGDGISYAELAYSEPPENDIAVHVLEVETALPWGVDEGALVLNYSAMATSDLAA